MATDEEDDRIIGFQPDEVALDEPTRSARLKWVIVLDAALGAGRAVNAAVCVAAATADSVLGLLGPGAVDANRELHPGLPWAGCSVLGGSAGQLKVLRANAGRSAGVYVADMPVAAQQTRVYNEYLATMLAVTDAALLAVSIVGPRNRVDKLTKGLTLLP